MKSLINRCLDLAGLDGALKIALVAILLISLGCGGSGLVVPQGYKPFFVYTANYGSNDISEFAGDGNGNLILLGKVACDIEPIALVNDGRFVFVVCGGNNISVYNIGKDGRLYFNSKIDTDTSKDADPIALTFGGYTYTGSYPNTLYAASDLGSIQAFAIHPNGTLTFKYENDNVSRPLARQS